MDSRERMSQKQDPKALKGLTFLESVLSQAPPTLCEEESWRLFGMKHILIDTRTL